MKKTHADSWLARQIESAKRSLDQHPDWMKSAAHFEGSVSSLSTGTIQEGGTSICVDTTKANKADSTT